MGALHAGHLSLIELAKRYSEHVVVSIFINPLQFENKEDLEKYPRNVDGDSALAIGAGATEIWAPTVEEIYPSKNIEMISAGKLGTLFEGNHRAGHFDGVLTVVDRLFKHVEPTHAIFGEKDFQQLFLIERWVKENSIPVEIVRGPLIRDKDGLALSSRNVRLESGDRVAATVISRALFAAAQESDLLSAAKVLREIVNSEPGFRLDYAELIDEESFEQADSRSTQVRALVAGWVNGVRLLDNMAMTSLGAR
ncbi:MAG: hypothetical protein RL414_1068 [Actinomycetota bacterium]|jgi:pantoate--beta-alanine ligase